MIDPNIWRRTAPAMALASNMTGSILVGVLVGSWIDRRYDTGPWFTVGLCFLGFGVGVWRLLNAPPPPPPDDPSPNPDP